MDNGLHHGHPVIRRIYLYIFIVTFLLLFVILAVYYSNYYKPSDQETSEATEVSQEDPVLQTEPKGAFTLAVKDNETAEVAAGQTFFLTVTASSEGSDIVGFDALFSYDQDAFTLGTATTPLQSFEVFSTPSETHQSFTAALTTNGTPIPFGDIEILTIPVTPTQKGKYTFTLLPSAGTETTKMVEAETTTLFAPEVTSLPLPALKNQNREKIIQLSKEKFGRKPTH